MHITFTHHHSCSYVRASYLTELCYCCCRRCCSAGSLKPSEIGKTRGGFHLLEATEGVSLPSQTPCHYDDQNYGLTFLIAFDVYGNLAPGCGSHVMCSDGSAGCVQVRDVAGGVCYWGDYRRVLHANRAVYGEGARLIVTAYCSKTLVDLVKRTGREGGRGAA